MGEVSTIGLDIAKSVFQVHGVDVAGAVVIRKRISRAKVLEYFGDLPPCLVGKRVPQRITGAASFRRLVTRSD
jgi:transposase